MSQETYKIEASVRDDLGKGASRRLRREGKIPAIVYGDNKPPVSLTINHNELLKRLDDDRFFTQIIDLNVGDQTDEVILRDLHRHPYKETIVLHADFQRITRGQLMRMHVPFLFENRDESKGAKAGGIFNAIYTEVEIESLPRHLPDHLTVDVIDLDLNETIRLSEVTLPEGVTIPELELGEEYDVAIVAYHPPRVEEEEPVEDEGVVSDEEPTDQQDAEES
ncbi:MAG: 50S ribosomal protein L25/general stress protein Ctc [Halothiobacillaceae bacterium]